MLLLSVTALFSSLPYASPAPLLVLVLLQVLLLMVLPCSTLPTATEETSDLTEGHLRCKKDPHLLALGMVAMLVATPICRNHNHNRNLT